MFTANFDRNTPVQINFTDPLKVKALQIRPIAWHKRVAMRLELIGCEDDRKFICSEKCFYVHL